MRLAIGADEFAGAGIEFVVRGGAVEFVEIDPDEASHGFLVLLADLVGAAWDLIDGES